MTNYMVKSGTGSGRICFTNQAKSGSGWISPKQIWCSPNDILYNMWYVIWYYMW